MAAASRSADIQLRLKTRDDVWELTADTGAAELLAEIRVETLEAVCLHELLHGWGDHPGRAHQSTRRHQGAVFKLEHADVVRVSTLGQYLQAHGSCWSPWSTTRIAVCRSTSGLTRRSSTSGRGSVRV